MSTGRHERCGFTLVEVVITLAITAVVVGAIAQSVAGMKGLNASADAQTELAESGNRALRRVLADLKRTGFATVDGLVYPYVFDNGGPGVDFAIHAHATADSLADWPVPASREIVFRIPDDADQNGIPDLDVDGSLNWDPQEYSYVLITGPDGINRLQRRVDGGGERTVARYVDRIVIDDAITSGFQIPLDTLRVRIDMAKPDGDGRIHELTLQGLVRARNGGIVQ